MATAAGTAGVVSLSAQAPQFLLESLAGAAEPARPGEKILVVVQLTGGNDGLNTVVPFRDDRYLSARPSLALGKSAVLKLDTDTGLHPNLKGLAKLFEDRQLSILQGVGYPNPNRSHFESMDIWHTARVKEGTRDLGWLGNAFDLQQTRLSQSADPVAIHLGAEVQPLALAARDLPSPSIRSLDYFRLDTGNNPEQRTAIQTATSAPRDSASSLLKFVQTRTTSALEVSQRLEHSAEAYKSSVKYPATPLAGKLRNIAQLIDVGLATRVYYVSLEGFDTHSDQAASHAGLMLQLGDALAAFQDDLNQHSQQDRVLTLVFSEFGRRVRENASRGTDHGAAAPVFLLGNKVRPGLLGKHPSLSDLDDGDLKFQTDFRSIYATLLENWLGWPATAVLGETFSPENILA